MVFIPQTEDKVSLEWLESTIQTTSDYSISYLKEEMDWKVPEDNVMYIRIDGDVVFLEDHTIPTIVKTKLDHQDSLMVSANVVNEAALASLHSHPGVALPYLPELYRVQQSSESNSEPSEDWRVSGLPQWNGPASFRVRKGYQPPFQGHRWLLPAEASSDRDPIASSMDTETGPALQDWTVGAQQHYSFLYHLESDTLNRYKFPIWVDPTEPISENFGCFWGGDAKALRGIFGGHSSYNDLYKSWMKRDGTRPHVSIDGKGLVSHLSTKMGVDGLDSTDLLGRYRAYAQERICRRS